MQNLIDKAIFYVTYMANADKGQWHVVMLVWSFKPLAEPN